MPHVSAGELEVQFVEAGAGEPVVCVHGNWGSWRWFAPVLERVPAGLHAHAIDLRGRGDTRGPDNTYSLVELADDLRRFIEAMGWSSAHLVGHSLGAGVILQMALDAPERARSLLCLAPPWIRGMPRVPGVRERQQALAGDRAAMAAAMRALFVRPPEPALFERLVDDAGRQRPAATIATVAALEEWQPGAALGTIVAPRAVVSGALDILVTPRHTAEAAAALGCEPVLLAGVGHALLPEAPQAVADAVAELVARA